MMDNRQQQRRTFVFNLEWAEILMDCAPATRLAVYDAVMAYAATGELVALEAEASMAFQFIRREIDRTAQRYEEICETNRHNARKGGAPKGNSNARKQPAENNRTVEKTTENNRTVDLNDENNRNNRTVEKTTETTLYECDNDNDINKKKISLREIKEKDSHTVDGGGVLGSPARGLLKNFKDIVEVMRADRVWQESVAMANKTDVETVVGLLDDFALHCRASDEEHCTVPSAKRHFNGWIKIKLKSKTSDENNDDKFARRRGTEPTGRGREDYAGAL